MPAEPSPLDETVGRTSATEAGSEHDAASTPKVLWFSVLVMCVGAGLIGLGFVLLSNDTRLAVISFIAGAVIGLIGAVIGLGKGIMSNVE